MIQKSFLPYNSAGQKAEKRKAEKAANPKPKAKTKARAKAKSAAAATLPPAAEDADEDWPDEDAMNTDELDGESLDSDENING